MTPAWRPPPTCVILRIRPPRPPLDPESVLDSTSAPLVEGPDLAVCVPVRSGAHRFTSCPPFCLPVGGPVSRRQLLPGGDLRSPCFLPFSRDHVTCVASLKSADREVVTRRTDLPPDRSLPLLPLGLESGHPASQGLGSSSGLAPPLRLRTFSPHLAETPDPCRMPRVVSPV